MGNEEFYVLLIEILSSAINDEIDQIEVQISEIKHERKNVSPEYFNFLNGKMEGLMEARRALHTIGLELSENQQMYVGQQFDGDTPNE